MSSIKLTTLFQIVVSIFLFSTTANSACNNYQLNITPPQVNGIDLTLGVFTSTTSHSYVDCPRIKVTPISSTDGQTKIISLHHSTGSSCRVYNVPTMLVSDNLITFTSGSIAYPLGVSCAAIGSYFDDHIALNLPDGQYTIKWIIDGGVHTFSYNFTVGPTPVPTLSIFSYLLLISLITTFIIYINNSEKIKINKFTQNMSNNN